MDRQEGLRQIQNNEWKFDEWGALIMQVNGPDGEVRAWIAPRPNYCDRGHFHLMLDGHIEIDEQDKFPRYFFTLNEAKQHARWFLAWKLWKHKELEHEAEQANLILAQLNMCLPPNALKDKV